MDARGFVSGSNAPEMVIAYFSMEIGLAPEIPTYSGGLGVLAGDMLRAAADGGVPLVGVTLLHRQGHFRQQLDAGGQQIERPDPWEPAAFVERLPVRPCVEIEGRAVRLAVWRYLVSGASGHTVPVYLLDSALPENDPADRELTDVLYGGDDRYRLCQEVILGIGGVAALEALGHERVLAYHMNEGHSALLTVALIEQQARHAGTDAIVTDENLAAVRGRCVFTTHTPVAAGHDRFDLSLAERVLGPRRAAIACAMGGRQEGVLNLTRLALGSARATNAVSGRHEEVSRRLFAGHPITSITNGVHAATWAAPALAALYDHHLPGWRADNQLLRYARRIPLGELRAAHGEAKRALLGEVRARTGQMLAEEGCTIGFARRATGYKRGDLLFTDIERLRAMGRKHGPLQVVYAGKAHPRDEGGKALIRRVVEAGRQLGDDVRVVYLEDYGMALAGLLVAGVDLWLNTPEKPHEASGTSGMKAAVNGVPSLSVLDGWWVEGHLEGITGWAVGEDGAPEQDVAAEAGSLYEKLERVILPLYRGQPDGYAEVMRGALALNGSFFTAQRMVGQYVQSAYRILG